MNYLSFALLYVRIKFLNRLLKLWEAGVIVSFLLICEELVFVLEASHFYGQWTKVVLHYVMSNLQFVDKTVWC